jgi:redox-sensitive bicupin YhaK (pirin superfamily)
MAVSQPILETSPLGPPPWPSSDPFLACMHHDDAYPPGNGQLGPAASLAGRRLGQDFEGKDGWRMYHGEVIPGFPQHPHRGFETVTVVRRGFIDHADSLGAAARYGAGDVQWLTAGGGIVHSEMFPLLETTRPNPLELFQIWLNLPAADKLVDPHFTMLWGRDIPRRKFVDDAGRAVEVTVVAGALDDMRPPSPPPHSWASRAEADVAIWTLAMEAGASFILPPAAGQSTVRTLYFFRGPGMRVAGSPLAAHSVIALRSDAAVRLEAGEGDCDLLLLQGRPIGEPIVQHGPFVMNSRAEIQRAFADYQRTHFGGWPWPSDDPVHTRDAGRFARHVDGRIERVES